MIVKYYQSYDFRDETSFTSVGGPNYWNEYLQYGVSHCDDFFYIFKVHNSIYEQRFYSLRSIDYSFFSDVLLFTSYNGH